MRTALLNLVDLFGIDALFGKEALRAAGCQNPEADIHQNADGGQNPFLVIIANRNEHRTGAWQVDACTQLRLGKGQCEVGIEADDFTGGAHFRSQQNIDAGETRKREDGFLDGNVLEVARVWLFAVSRNRCIQRFASHDTGGDLGNRRADGLGNERHGPRCAGVHFQHVDRAVLDGILHVHQATNMQRLGKRRRLAFQLVQHVLGKRARWQRAGAVTRVNTGFLDVFHDAGYEDVLAIAQRIHVHFNGVRQVAIEQQRVLAQKRVDLAGLVVGVTLLDILRHEAGNRIQQVALQHAFIVNDLHGAATENVGRANDQREADFGRHDAGLLDGIGNAIVRLRQIELHQQLLETVAVFGKVDHIGCRAKDRDTVLFERFGKLQRRLAAELHDNADQFTLFLLSPQNFDHVFGRQWLEIEAV